MIVPLKTILAKMRVLAGQSFFIRDEVVLNALGRKMRAHATDAAHVDRMLDTWTSRTTEMLRIADVAALAAESMHCATTLADPCSACAQSGGYFVIRENNGHEFAARCDCMRGLALRVLDSARRANGLKHSEVA